mmetsp:Transcript_134515/g.335596  ORF Transcript_134515/g.335596 Transcript_134515/m.335596 type:complete len:278 (-) Transcript_134515:415-1248(-)
MLGDLPQGLCREIAQHLWLGDLLPFATACQEQYWVATKVADAHFKLNFGGMSPSRHLRLGCRAVPDWLATFMSLRPRPLACGHSTKWPSQTCALPFKLDTHGPWFVEFKFVAAKAPNGTPGVGVVDAATPGMIYEDSTNLWPCDLSRQSSSPFAMSLSPYDGTLFGTWSDAQTCNRAQLNWEPIYNEQWKWNAPMRCGFLLENHCLTFFRTDGRGQWHSGEMVSKDLPAHVFPCMFMSSYLGYTHVRFERLWNSPPEICPHCDAAYSGLAKPFRSWP